MRLVALLLAALCMLHAAAARKFFTPETDSEVLHGTVALNVTVRPLSACERALRRFIRHSHDSPATSPCCFSQAHARNAEGKPMLTMHEMHVPVEVEGSWRAGFVGNQRGSHSSPRHYSRRAVKKGTQLPEVVHFQNTMTQGRSLQNSYKKLGLPQLAEKIRNFKIKEE